MSPSEDSQEMPHEKPHEMRHEAHNDLRDPESKETREEDARFALLVNELREKVEQAIEDGRAERIPAEDVTKLLTGAVKLYAVAVEEGAREVAPIDRTVSTTEAVVVACALMRAHNLNPFDLALWFSHSGMKAGAKSVPGDGSSA
jgi:hypothetical protein